MRHWARSILREFRIPRISCRPVRHSNRPHHRCQKSKADQCTTCIIPSQSTSLLRMTTMNWFPLFSSRSFLVWEQRLFPTGTCGISEREAGSSAQGLSHGESAKPATFEETRRLLVLEKGNDSYTRDTCQTKTSPCTTAKKTRLAVESDFPNHLVPQNGPDRLGLVRVDTYRRDRFDPRRCRRSLRPSDTRVIARIKESSMSSSMWAGWISRKDPTIEFRSKDRSTDFRSGDSSYWTAC